MYYKTIGSMGSELKTPPNKDRHFEGLVVLTNRLTAASLTKTLQQIRQKQPNNLKLIEINLHTHRIISDLENDPIS